MDCDDMRQAAGLWFLPDCQSLVWKKHKASFSNSSQTEDLKSEQTEMAKEGALWINKGEACVCPPDDAVVRSSSANHSRIRPNIYFSLALIELPMDML